MGRWIDELSTEMVRDPAKTLFLLCGRLIFMTVGITIILALLLGGIIYIKTVLMFIAAFLLVLTLAVFYIFFGIGWALAHLLLCVKFACIWFGIFVVAHIILIAWIAGVLAVSTLVSYAFVKIVTSSEKLMQFLGFKINGYHKARSDNAARREELQRLANIEALKLKKEKEERKQKKADGEIPYSLLEKIVNGLEVAGVAFINWCGEFFVARTKNVKGGTYKVCTGFGVLWETCKSLYHGVCPFVEFVNEDEEEEAE
jgi:ABC-type multidrug transport system fused ATPase/permease subunit